MSPYKNKKLRSLGLCPRYTSGEPIRVGSRSPATTSAEDTITLLRPAASPSPAPHSAAKPERAQALKRRNILKTPENAPRWLGNAPCLATAEESPMGWMRSDKLLSSSYLRRKVRLCGIAHSEEANRCVMTLAKFSARTGLPRALPAAPTMTGRGPRPGKGRTPRVVPAAACRSRRRQSGSADATGDLCPDFPMK